ncbi:lipopeptide mating pheromone precursor bbp2-8 [Schizophyllum commune]
MDSFTTLSLLDGTMPTFEDDMPVSFADAALPLSGDCFSSRSSASLSHSTPFASPSPSSPSQNLLSSAKATADPHLVVNADSPCGFGGGYCVVA